MDPILNPTIADGSLSDAAKVGNLPHQESLITTPPGGSPAGPLATGEKSANGEAYDPALHESPPRQNSKGGWARKRGNGARKAKGLPNAGAAPVGRGGSAPAPATPPAPGAPPPAAPPAFASGSRIGSTDPVAGDGAITPDEVLGPAALTEADYQSTGEAVTRGLFGMARLTLDGKAWEPTPEEKRTFSACIARIFAHYGWPRLGPVVELFFLVPPTVAARADQPRTKRVLDWLTSWLPWRHKVTVAPDPQTVAARAEASEPAPAPRSVGGGGNPQSTNPRFQARG